MGRYHERRKGKVATAPVVRGVDDRVRPEDMSVDGLRDAIAACERRPASPARDAELAALRAEYRKLVGPSPAARSFGTSTNPGSSLPGGKILVYRSWALRPRMWGRLAIELGRLKAMGRQATVSKESERIVLMGELERLLGR